MMMMMIIMIIILIILIIVSEPHPEVPEPNLSSLELEALLSARRDALL